MGLTATEMAALSHYASLCSDFHITETHGRDAIQSLVINGLLEPTGFSKRYQITKKGRKHLDKCLSICVDEVV